MQAGDAEVERTADHLEAKVDRAAQPLAFTASLLERSYRELFRQGAATVTITPSAALFPPLDLGRRRIQAPSKTPELRQGDALEAALLMTALVEVPLARRGVDLTLVASEPTVGEQATQRVYLAWRTRASPWQALDLTRTGELDFQENTRLATHDLEGLLSSAPRLGQIDQRPEGVFWEEAPVLAAVNLARAAQHYGIHGLPD